MGQAKAVAEQFPLNRFCRHHAERDSSADNPVFTPRNRLERKVSSAFSQTASFELNALLLPEGGSCAGGPCQNADRLIVSLWLRGDEWRTKPFWDLGLTSQTTPRAFHECLFRLGQQVVETIGEVARGENFTFGWN
jgi:hypothetical protein